MRIATAVVGAGPAGLLFCVVARLLQPRADWPLWLFDKRLAYERTHRLRMERAPYEAIARAVDDPRFDALLAFLEAERFRPAVNHLEERLAALAADLGVVRERLEVGPGLDLAGLRRHLESRLEPGAVLTIVGADSVHSAVREMVRGDVPIAEQTHQVLARLRIVGDDLPESLGWVARYKMSKVLASLLDYRLNPNGFAELDLFLTPQEHAAVEGLGATPRDPVRLEATRLAALSAPLFRAIVARAAEGFGGRPCEVWLQSTFRLEHRTIERVAFDVPAGRVFLVGDAALSLPFFRGMSSLARCALALAQAHVDLVGGADLDAVGARYDAEVAAIRREELAVVAGRAWLVRGAREFFRISAALPFPMQTWLLSEPDRDERPDPPSPGWLANLGLAAPAAAVALGALVAGAYDAAWLAAWLLAVPLQAGGGVAYAAARAFEGGPHRRVRAVWRWQIALLLVAGVPLAAWTFPSPVAAVAALSWFVLAGPFVAGMLAFEALDRRWWARAALGDPDGPEAHSQIE